MLFSNDGFLSRVLAQVTKELHSSRLALAVSAGMGVLGVVGICIGIFFLFQPSTAPETPPEVPTASFSPDLSSIKPEVSPEIMAEVSGAVKKPGVYRVSGDARVSDLISQAEGFAPTVDQDFVDQELHLTEKLTDGFKLFIPSRGKGLRTSASSVSSDPDKVNVNVATAEELNLLPGVGEKRVQKILDERPFTSLEEFSAKTGITGKSLKEIEQILSF